MRKIKLAVIFGGMSTEHDVSIVSGASVLNNLDKEKYEIFPIYIDAQGIWNKYVGNIKTLSTLHVGDKIDNIEKIEKEVVSYARQELSKLDYLDLYMSPNEENHSSVISFNIKGVHPHDVASMLDFKGVCVRSGNHCAQPLLRYMGIDSTCRASFSIYNTKEDVDRLVDAIKFAYSKFEKFIKR